MPAVTRGQLAAKQQSRSHSTSQGPSLKKKAIHTNALSAAALAVAEPLANIYKDFEDHFEHSSWDADVRELSQCLRGDNAAFVKVRLDKFKGTQDVVLLACLFFSKTFVNALNSRKNGMWKAISDGIMEMKHSLAVYAMTRQCPWVESLSEGKKAGVFKKLGWRVDVNGLKRKFSYKVREHPDLHFLPLERKNLEPKLCITYDEKQPEHIEVNLYDKAAFGTKTFPEKYKPDSWPLDWQYPGDPTVMRTPKGTMYKCPDCKNVCIEPQDIVPGFPLHNQDEGCQCEPTWLHPRIQIQEMYLTDPVDHSTMPNVPIVNCAVRALQDFEAGDFLGEYVGKLWPAEQQDASPTQLTKRINDDVYLFGPERLLTEKFTTSTKHSETSGEGDLYYISSKIYGNWTRYCNTRPTEAECNTDFFTGYSKTTASQKRNGRRVMLRAKRDIKFGDEITLDYGSGYREQLFGKEATKPKR